MHRLLVCFGNAEGGRLGLGRELLTSQLIPKVVASLARYNVHKVACGAEHTAVVTSEFHLLFGVMAALLASYGMVFVALCFPAVWADVNCVA